MKKHYKNPAFISKVGAKILEIRTAKKISQEDLEKLTGFDIRQIGRVLRGETNPTISTIERIATALGVEPKDLLDFELKQEERFQLQTPDDDSEAQY